MSAMFRIVGADGAEYGPVSVDELRLWIESERANANTKAKKEGSSDWRNLGDFSEFADEFTSTPQGVPTGNWLSDVSERRTRAQRADAELRKITGQRMSAAWDASNWMVKRLLDDVGACLYQRPNLITVAFWKLMGAGYSRNYEVTAKKEYSKWELSRYGKTIVDVTLLLKGEIPHFRISGSLAKSFLFTDTITEDELKRTLRSLL